MPLELPDGTEIPVMVETLSIIIPRPTHKLNAEPVEDPFWHERISQAAISGIRAFCDGAELDANITFTAEAPPPEVLEAIAEAEAAKGS